MKIVLHDTAQSFADAAGPVLRADPLRNTIALTVLDGMCREGHEAAALLTVHEGGEVVGAALRSPGRGVLVSALPPRYAAAAESALAEADLGLAGCGGPLAEAEAFAAAHTARTGERARAQVRSRLFVLDALVPPVGVPGAARRAGEPDADLLGRWRLAFAEEAHEAWTYSLSPREIVLSGMRMGYGEMLWEVGGQPVAQASARARVAGMIRIGPVYTPPEHRGRGYAAAVTAAASRWALDAGAEQVVLFTDLANPISNRLYPRIGYRPVYDAVDLHWVSS